jgi:hypothetical protein
MCHALVSDLLVQYCTGQEAQDAVTEFPGVHTFITQLPTCQGILIRYHLRVSTVVLG